MSANSANFTNSQSRKNIVELVDKEEVYKIVGAAMEVHKTLGCGFFEGVYQEGLEIEFREQKIPFVSQKDISVQYKNHKLSKKYVADFIVFDRIIVEIKAESHLTSIDEAQLLNYLKATGFKVGVLINFGSRNMEWKRIVKTQ